MRGLWFILFIIAVQVISALIQHRKKVQARKAREAAIQPRLATQVGQTPATAPPSQPQRGEVPTLARTGPAGGSSAADLEDRRRAQLEQLRQRRENRRTGIPPAAPVPASSQRRGMPVLQQPSTRAPMSVAPPLGMSDQARSRAQEAATRAREAERQKREQQARLANERQEIADHASHIAFEAGFHALADVKREIHRHDAPSAQSAMAVAVGRPGSGDRAGATAAALGKRLREPATVREMILMREILDKPLALRGPAV